MKRKKERQFLLKAFHFIRTYYITALFIAGGATVVVFGLIALFFLRGREYVYVRVQLSPGAWWGRAAKPSVWHSKAIKVGEKEISILGSTLAEVIEVDAYPWEILDEYNTYVTARIYARYNKVTKTYSFKDSSVAVGAPIILEFPSVFVTGTVIDISSSLPKKKYIEKTLILTKKYAYLWEYDVLKIGDSVYSGKKKLLTIVDKELTAQPLVTDIEWGLYNPLLQEEKFYITLKVKAQLFRIGNEWFFGEDQVIRRGKLMKASFADTQLEGYTVADIL